MRNQTTSSNPGRGRAGVARCGARLRAGVGQVLRRGQPRALQPQQGGGDVDRGLGGEQGFGGLAVVTGVVDFAQHALLVARLDRFGGRRVPSTPP